MCEEKRTLIETYLPVEEISEEAKKEKSGTAKPRTFEMHFWWTRKPLIAARAAVLGSLLPSDYNPQEFKKMLGLGKEKRAHNYNLTAEQHKVLLEKSSQLWGNKQLVLLDPFSGGGSIPFEAMRAGLNVISNDYNPLANVIEKTTLEYPLKYGERLYIDVKTALDSIFEDTKIELEKYYPKIKGNDPVAYIFAWEVFCPECRVENPLVGSWWLTTNKNKVFLEPHLINGNIELAIKSGDEAPEGNCSDGKGLCLSCGKTISNDVIRKDIINREKERLLAIVVKKSKGNGKEYVLPIESDYQIIDEVKDLVSSNWDYYLKEDLIPLEEIPEDTRGSLSARLYLDYWYKVLNPRQRLFMVTLLKNSRDYSNKLSNHDSDYKEAITCYIALMLGKCIDYNCRSATWASSLEVISSTMGRRGVAMLWDHVEVNPFVKSSGSLLNVNKSILDGLKYSIDKLTYDTNVEITNNSITSLDKKADLIITDPPYFDDVRYAEFSEFFYTWERKILSLVLKAEAVQKNEDMSVGGCNRTKDHFYRLFHLTCKKMHNMLSNEGMLVMFFAHSSIEAWDFVINSLQNAGFKITATWPIHTEFTNNPLARGNASIMSSIIIVARKRQSDKSGFIEEIQDEVEQHLKKRLEEFWNYGLLGADLTVSAMGATLDVITQYSEIKSYTGKMNVKDVLALVQKYVSEYVLSKYLKNPSGLDGQTSFYLYSRLSGMDGMPFDTANLVSKSLNVNLKQFEADGSIESIKKGKSKGVKILKYNEREVNKKQSLIDVVQYIMIVFERSGISDVIKEMDESPFSREEITNVLEAMLSLPAEDVERKAAQRIIDQMGRYTPSKAGQQSIVDNY